MPDKVWPEGVQYPIYFSQIRYHDNNGRLITPIADDQGDPVQMPPPPQPDSNFSQRIQRTKFPQSVPRQLQRMPAVGCEGRMQKERCFHARQLHEKLQTLP